MPSGAGGNKAQATGGSEAPVSLGPGSRNPADRLKEHADKKRQFEARKAYTPGPGAYTPIKPNQTLNGNSSSNKTKGSLGGSSSFASKTKRMNVTNSSGSIDASGDPGSYDPYTLKELAVTSKKSASKSMKAGAGSFGTRNGRRLNIELQGESTPGPGAYNGGAMMRSGKKAHLAALDSGEKMPSSSFKSKTVQRAKAHNEHVPGAGAYTPNHNPTQKTLAQNPAHSMKAKGKRFTQADSWERAQATEPGPGAYEIEYLRSGAKSSVAAPSRGTNGPKEIAFQSDALRELPWEVS